MKKLIIVIIISVLICGMMHTSCSSNPTLPRIVVMGEPDEYVTIADEMCEKLETAFKQLSNDSLEHFFSDWNAAFSFETDMQNNVIEEIYKIYKEFYQPLDVKLNSDSKYAVVQNNFRFAILDEELFDKWHWLLNTCIELLSVKKQ
ncbi:MAG: hypothetical protein FWG85_02945 [Bacteroidetes bacterium]|nr:hypothetical protein [Bacteroidota bacterium]